jgi:hypothetical protein
MVQDTQFAWYPEYVPEELQAGRFWVCCSPEKVPEVAASEPVRRASTTNPSTWRTFEEAQEALEDGRHAGAGRVIVADGGFVGVDLDGVRDPGSRTIDEGALQILQHLDSYCEVSPSGRGVKCWVRADLKRSYVKPGLEVYRGGRYFVVTGQFLSQFPPVVEERQREIDELVAREFPTQPRRAEAGEPYHGPSLDLGPFLDLDAVEILQEVPDGLGRKYRIRCPWIQEHSDADDSGTYLGQRENGGTWFVCHHSHCEGRGWREFRERVGRRAPTAPRGSSREISIVTPSPSTNNRRTVVIRFD